ncbi:MAG: hypothetical protein ACREB8_15535, partial [Pseudolabrys sp.]
MLLTDGTVIVHNAGSQNWYRLTPNSAGSYVSGTWSSIASLPSGYAPQYFASAVLPDGRVIINGGEYNGNTNNWTNKGAIYDPVANAWTSVTAPNNGASPWNEIGDAQSVVLANGTYMLASCCANPSADALLNASNLTWSTAGAPSGYQNEQGYTLLPDGSVLTISVWSPPHTQKYNPATNTWSSAADTPVSLIDPTACGNYETGPSVLRPDGTVVAFGGNTGCSSASTKVDPTAIYNSANNTWIQGPNVPTISGKNYDLADAPAALLPNGNILFAASPGYGSSPTHFFEFTSSNVINQVSDPSSASGNGAYVYNFLVLPTGQILMTDFSNRAQIYTPTGSPNASWAPVITTVPTTLAPGQTYQVSGLQLNGLSQGAAYGDDAQAETNYPLVRIINNASGHVFYARTSNHSTMSVAPNTAGSTSFLLPAGIESGLSSLVVVANGIPSQAVPVNISSSPLQVTPFTNIASSGNYGGQFTPSSFPYQLQAASGSIKYSISGIPSWLHASSTSGTVTTSPTTVTLSVNSSANSLCGGTYNATIAFNDTTNNKTALTVSATLTVTGTSALVVTSSTDIVSSGNQGGTFSPSSFQYQLSATNCTTNYSISGVPSWLDVSSGSGTLTTAPTTVTFTVNSSANNLTPGGYNATVNLTNTTNGLGNQTRNATLTVNSPPPPPPKTPRTWVSGTGNDNNDCSLAAPCATFAGAIAKTAAGGEINCLDSGGFGGLTITQSVSIVCKKVKAGVLVSGTSGIVINAGAGDAIELSGLDINGNGTGLNGVYLVSGGALHIANSLIRGFQGNNPAGNGVVIAPSAGTVQF